MGRDSGLQFIKPSSCRWVARKECAKRVAGVVCTICAILNSLLPCTSSHGATVAGRKYSSRTRFASVAVSDVFRPIVHTVVFFAFSGDFNSHSCPFFGIFYSRCRINRTGPADQSAVRKHFIHDFHSFPMSNTRPILFDVFSVRCRTAVALESESRNFPDIIPRAGLH